MYSVLSYTSDSHHCVGSYSQAMPLSIAHERADPATQLGKGKMEPLKCFVHLSHLYRVLDMCKNTVLDCIG